MKNYDKYLGRARQSGIKTHCRSAFAMAFFFFNMFAYYAYAFYTGSWLITEQVVNTRSGTPYNSGDILSCFFGVIFGVFALGQAAPNIKAVTEGKIAGKMAYELIERVPQIKLDNPDYKPVG